MKTKLLKRLRRQAQRKVGIPGDMFDWVFAIYGFRCEAEVAKFYNDQLRAYILVRVAGMRRWRARRIIVWPAACIAMCSLSMVISFITGDWRSGMAWFCAMLAWMVVVKYERQEYENIEILAKYRNNYENENDT